MVTVPLSIVGPMTAGQLRLTSHWRPTQPLVLASSVPPSTSIPDKAVALQLRTSGAEIATAHRDDLLTISTPFRVPALTTRPVRHQRSGFSYSVPRDKSTASPGRADFVPSAVG